MKSHMKLHALPNLEGAASLWRRKPRRNSRTGTVPNDAAEAGCNFYHKFIAFTQYDIIIIMD